MPLKPHQKPKTPWEPVHLPPDEARRAKDTDDDGFRFLGRATLFTVVVVLVCTAVTLLWLALSDLADPLPLAP